MSKRFSGMFPAALLAAAGLAPAAAPVHVCRPMPDSITVDGVLDEPAWRGRDTLRLVKNDGPAGGSVSEATKVLVGWSATTLYAAFIVDAKNLKNTVTQHDGPLYEQDVVEMFLDPDGDSKNYVELEWNCIGTTLDYTFTGPSQGDNTGWSYAGMKSAVKARGTPNHAGDVDTGMVVEIALPWDGIKALSKTALPPKAGDALPLNFYRISYPASGSAELMAWSPTGAANFHMPDKFGSLSFSSQPVTLRLPKRAGARPGGAAAARPAPRRADGKLYIRGAFGARFTAP